MDWFDRVKERVKLKGTTIEAVAAKADLSRDSYNTYRRRGLLPRVNEGIAIAEALDTSVEYLAKGNEGAQYVRDLVAREGLTYRPPDRIASIVEDLNLIDDGQLETVKKIVRALAGEIQGQEVRES